MAAFGCDLGASRSKISVIVKQDRDPVNCLPVRAESLAEGMSSAVYVKAPDGELKVFSMEEGSAEKEILQHPENAIYAVKTKIHLQEPIHLENIRRAIPMEEAYAAIVRALVTLGNTERRNRGEDPLYDIVFTYPVMYAGDADTLNRMQKAIESVELDHHHLKVLDRIPEPAAAGLDYLYYTINLSPMAGSKDHMNILVYDLGHGTWDASVLTVRASGQAYDVLCKDGLPDVGGKLFDHLLVQDTEKQLKKYGVEIRNAGMRERLRRACVACKRDLSEPDHESAKLDLSSLPGVDTKAVPAIRITRKQFEDLILPRLNETFEKTEQLIEYAQKHACPIDTIVITGGSGQIPAVKQRLQEIAGSIPVRVFRPYDAVANGAARYACRTEQEKLLEQRSDFQYGHFEAEGLDGTVVFDLDNGKKLPAESREIRLISPSSSMLLRVLRSQKINGENRKKTGPADCEVVRYFSFDVPAGEECSFRMTLEEDNNVTVVCRQPDGAEVRKSTKDHTK